MQIRCCFRIKTVIIAASLLIVLAGQSFASFLPAKRLYKQGENYLSDNDNHRAYLVFREIVREHPTSEYADDAHFLIAHYYLQQKDYFQAENEFLILIKNYPDSPYVKDAREYFSKMRSRFLEDKVLNAMNNGDYKTAKAFLEEMLSMDSENEDVKAKLKEVDSIIARIDLQRKQIEEEKVRIEEESEAIKKAREEVARLREEAEKAMRNAEKKSDEVSSQYNSLVEEAKRREEDLENQIARLERDLKEWRERAKKYEAQQLAGKNKESSQKTSESESFAIVFEGMQNDPAPEPGEKPASDIIKDHSPSILLVSETVNIETNIMKAEFIISLELLNRWLEKHYLKFRVDYTPAAGIETKKPTIIYYTTADMDEVNPESGIYRKKIIVAIDKSRIDKYSVSAFFVRKE